MRLKHLGLATITLLSIAQAVTAATTYSGPYELHSLTVTDGDTLRATVAVWPGQSVETAIRLRGINAAESTPGAVGKMCGNDMACAACELAAGNDAKERLQELVSVPGGCMLYGPTPDKYAGRVGGQVRCGGVDIAQSLLAERLVREYDGGARVPWCASR